MPIDLRSDTITKPTPAMRAAMAAAEVGDDVLGDDPTVTALEKRTAEILGKPAAVYMPSGTMTNQVAIRSHTEPGDEILLDANAHVYFYEGGAPAAISGVMCRFVDAKRGIFTPQQLKAAMRPVNIHHPRTKLVCMENTHNRGGGAIWPLDQIAAVEATARAAGLKMHLDGARLWNASAATGIAMSDYARHFDSVSVCFSKGLGAPVGSALVGTPEFIDRARRFRKMFGGGMRQSGIIAAGALFALEHNRQRLADDHANAKALAQGVVDIPGIDVDLKSVETNIVIFNTPGKSAVDLANKLIAQGVWVMASGPESIRAVTNMEVSADQIQQVIKIIRNVMAR